jgi:uncharacterized OsmC-like protein
MTMNATTHTAPAPKKTKAAARPLNGVDTPSLFATINAVGQQPELAKFQFRASNRWVKGTHSRSRMEPYAGAGGEHEQTGNFEYDADHPPVLCGAGVAPSPVEYLLHALATCLTAGIANIAAARGVALTEVTSTVEGDIDVQGILGLNDDVRNGYERLRVSFNIKGDAPAEKLQQLVEQSRARSAVFDVITNRVPIEISVNAG